MVALLHSLGEGDNRPAATLPIVLRQRWLRLTCLVRPGPNTGALALAMAGRLWKHHWAGAMGRSKCCENLPLAMLSDLAVFASMRDAIWRAMAAAHVYQYLVRLGGMASKVCPV